MESTDIKEILEKQLQLLSEDSKGAMYDGDALAEISRAMVMVSAEIRALSHFL